MINLDVLDSCLDLIKENKGAYSINITLLVNGSIISGELIHLAVDLKGVADLLTISQDGMEVSDTAKIMAKSFRNIAEEILQNPKASEVDDEAIYMKSVVFWCQPNSNAIEKSFLVLRKDAIDGFAWGVLSDI
jgi:hypothetical protein